VRGALPGLPSPHPLGETLPGIYRDDDFTQRMCGGLDEVLAPVLTTLDNLTAYLDPGTTPPDVLTWLAGWVGIALDGESDPDRRRALVRKAVALHGTRGTAAGVVDAVEVAFGVVPEIEQSGEAAWSTSAEAPLPGSAEPGLLVRLRVADPESVDRRRLDAVVGAVKPVHVPHSVDVVGL
jgi:phage tail-like protein